MKRLLTLARERNLDRIAIGYLVSAWVAVQAGSIALPAFSAPGWALKLLLTLAVIGLPLTLLAAWFWTKGHPLGVQSESEATRWNRDLVLLAVAIGFVLVAAGAEFVYFQWRQGQLALVPPASAAEPSIAVLPFANLSGDPKKVYFSDGIADQLINALSQIPALHVAARTSSFSFRGKKQDVKSIARALNVRSVLEGSVLGAGNRVRIAVELVDAQTGFQVWSRSYDRDLSDILAVQDSIAHQIAEALGRHLLGKAAPATHARRIDPESYRLFLQGRFFAARDAEADYRRAADLFRQVTVRAPDYADGFAEYGSALIALASDYGDSAALVPAEQAARHALTLDGRNLLALRTLMLGSIARWDWLAAADRFGRARAIDADSAGVLHSQSVLAATMNFPLQDFEAEKKAADLDPLSFVAHYNLAVWYFQQGRYDDAAKAQQNALLLQPANPAGRDSLCSIQVARGKLAEAHRIASSLATVYAADPEWRIGCPLDLALAEGRKAEARKFADGVAAGYSASGGGATYIGNAYRSLGDVDRAMVWYERAYAARERDLLLVPADRLQSAALLGDPRWKRLWARQPIRDWESARHEVGAVLGASG